MAWTIEDPLLGSFDWDDALDCWQGSLALPSGRVVQLAVEPATAAHTDQPDSSAVFAAAHAVAAWLRESEADAYAVVSRAMLDLYNRSWSQEPPITAEEFARRIELLDVTVPSDGKSFPLWFTNGEMAMFGGHAIDAYCGADWQLVSASLAD
jgi:hypothetical protein